MKFTKEQVIYTEVTPPESDFSMRPVDITDATIQERRTKILALMKQRQYDALAVYADREHSANFEYLTGFGPRFEEALLVLHADGRAYLLLGNEMLHMINYCRIEAEAIHVPYFSLPNQPMGNEKSLRELMASAGMDAGMRIGLAGWKMFTAAQEDNARLIDVPGFITDTIRSLAGEDRVTNACDLFIHPSYGARIHINANEIAHYEFGASLASAAMLHMQTAVQPGMTELELADMLDVFGQPGNVQTICATGDRFTGAVVAPRDKQVRIGDKFSATTGYSGGLTNRAGYAVHDASELPAEVSDYIEKVAKPYYSAAASWYASIALGMTGGELYALIDSVIPKKEYGWTLNPGHFSGRDEWVSSPVYPGSDAVLKSGCMLQMDIIIKVPGYGGINAEDGIALADEALRAELAADYPQVWERVCRRRIYMEKELGIALHPEVLPLSDMQGYIRPFVLNKEKALRIAAE